ncbi:MAG: hypothetical protein B6U72_02965 [Candidatus Altiarchaeales archaeon ex4484_2]|nr:MAG: hypothetical protein B6U72_02965 [Candidatus Altiarchaeales archaeon ex4484_2]
MDIVEIRKRVRQWFIVGLVFFTGIWLVSVLFFEPFVLQELNDNIRMSMILEAMNATELLEDSINNRYRLHQLVGLCSGLSLGMLSAFVYLAALMCFADYDLKKIEKEANEIKNDR